MVPDEELIRLYADVEWAKSQNLPRLELHAALLRLYQRAESDREYRVYAARELGVLLVREQPFAALRYCQEALKEGPTAELECTSGIAHLLLGHDKSAEAAFRRALELEPEDVSSLHNLGHLLDVAKDAPSQALPLLGRAAELAPHEPQVLSSLAHAQLRAGDADAARDTLARAVRGDREAVEHYLQLWTTKDS